MSAAAIPAGVAAPGAGVFDEDWGATARGPRRPSPAAAPAPVPAPAPGGGGALSILAAGLLLGCGALRGWGR